MTTSPAPVRQLRRASDDKQVGGVCAGVARYFGVDPALVRIVWLLAALFGGTGLFVYFVAWMVIPEDDGHARSHDFRPINLDFGSSDGRKIFGVVLITMAVLFASDGLWLGNGVLFPLVLIAAGAWLVFRTSDEDESTSPLWTPPTMRRDSPPDDAGTRWSAGAAAPASAGTAPSTVDAADDTGPGSDDEVDRLLEAARAYERGDHLLGDEMSPVPTRPARGPRLTLAAVGVLVVVTSLLVVIDRVGVVDLGVETVLALALGFVGVLLIGGSLVGRVRGLVPIGALLTLAVLATAAVDVPFEGSSGSRVVRISSVSDLESEYRMMAGELTLDLRPLDGLTEGSVDVAASVALGSLVVLVDDDVRVRGVASVDLGDIAVPDDGDRRRTSEGAGIESTFDVGSSIGTIDLDLDVGLGEIEVRRG